MAFSINLGKYITVRTVHGKWGVRTAKWEVRYDMPTEELQGVLSAVRRRSEGESLKDSLYRIRTYCQDAELREFANGLKEANVSRKSKYEKAIESLKSLGVEPNRLLEWMKKIRLITDKEIKKTAILAAFLFVYCRLYQ